MKSQKGFTLTELLVSITLLAGLTGLGLRLYLQSEQALKIAESEANMQQSARIAITKIAEELRQASDYFEVPFDGLPQAKEILFIRPVHDHNSGQVSGNILVRYWFHQNTEGVYSLLRAEKNHGSETHLNTSDGEFEPDPEKASDRESFKITPLIREATVIEPGKQSYFQQNRSQLNLVTLRLVTATYGYVRNPQSAQTKLEVKRRFRLDTTLDARNLNL
ncbi:hypothetical protein COW36_11215 [bacterium (Candidatus Blackallbacteria) CG17_big_fil_post_rev_8_21_14_2_50_48_46]|uniref:Prepilin-type N-terminal cleavage/methylation domain-containing protein n=1 Tax=bacterium (Candidatus Blackallbacteria) CG17_big_fil_post_rev_8_21_14_2_50_48_46 TaxID=2014261 RepID=A0A2M7G5J2_9BACT|nr:MAG: hypothetical protein COW64_18310 [bacterium (Candidatus Blackallbacteria) CG18_big_fil_WC_8_21_14_2_50_49_26]PIW16844.1 MAG: hypothetical protein COW36_11215 [bacterium (Candidatus Blackallbacteria) CG17_big_fil_post_rev_8_21_14_2_50_48_46]PIW48041.1 MAG: hypothetical protein COW20_10930 [bacterium (Candidatus Blackallbacteria) CG13_big_fil_rev_8_21_14_2_50_49_14]